MSKLYSVLADTYHEMYQSIFDYPREFATYRRILAQHKAKRVLEIGCGSGNLAQFFLTAGFDYTGMDLSRKVISIAKTVAPTAKFLQGDMRNFLTSRKFDAALVT